MMKKAHLGLLLLLLVCLNGELCLGAEYKLSMLPRYFPEKLSAMITPLAAYLTAETGDIYTPILTDNFSMYQTEIQTGNIWVGYENPLVYVNISNVHEVIATAVKGEGGDKFWGIVITRPDSDLHTLKDLVGKKIMIVSKLSAGGFLSQKLSLRQNDIDVEKDCHLVEAADNRQENVIISVSLGDVDAGFIRDSALHIADQYIMPDSIKVMTETAWLPNWAFSVNRNLPQEKKEGLQRAMVKLSTDSSVMKAIGLTGFKPAVDSDYDVMRKILQ